MAGRLRGFLAGNRVQGSGFLGGKLQFPHLHTGNDPAGLRAYVYQTQTHGAHLTGGQLKVLLPSVSYFLFFNKLTPAWFAGGSTFMVPWLLLPSAQPSNSNAGLGWRSLALIHPVLYSKEPCDLWGSLFSYASVSLFVQCEETRPPSPFRL